jgi:hypothetical protein
MSIRWYTYEWLLKDAYDRGNETPHLEKVTDLSFAFIWKEFKDIFTNLFLINLGTTTILAQHLY